MHVSPFSDALGASGLDRSALAHRDGLLRGLAILGIFALLFGLTCLGNALHPADADAAPVACRQVAHGVSVAAGRPCRAAVMIRTEASVPLRP